MNGTFVPLSDGEAMYVFSATSGPAPRPATVPTPSTSAGVDRLLMWQESTHRTAILRSSLSGPVCAR